MNYAVKVSDKNLGSSIHSVECRVVVNKTRRDNVFIKTADSAAALKAEWDTDNDNIERGLPVTKICKCCK